jgi:hypothetical protein
MIRLAERLEEFFPSDPPPARDEVTNAFWCACHGGQMAMAEHLLSRGAEINWIGHNGLTPLDAASRSAGAELVEWLRRRGAQSGHARK